MKRKTKWLLGALLMLASLPLMWRGIEAYDYANSDSISRAGIDTERILARYERNGDATELRRWITDGPTEAPGTQRDSVLGRWAQENPAKLAELIEGMTKREREVFFERFLYQVNDLSKFQAAFRGQQSPAIAQMNRYLNELITPLQ